jgi:hypothetical protein
VENTEDELTGKTYWLLVSRIENEQKISRQTKRTDILYEETIFARYYPVNETYINIVILHESNYPQPPTCKRSKGGRLLLSKMLILLRVQVR